MKLLPTKRLKNKFLQNLTNLSSKGSVVILLIIFSVLVFQNIGWSQVDAKRKVIKGHITNEKGEPAQGASVTVKGTSNGTNADASGNFTLSAGTDAVLVFSYVGYQSKEIKVINSNTINVQLLLSVNNDLDQVIVVGYGTQGKREVTGSVTSVSAITLKEVPSPNLVDQLKGRTAGVDIVSNGTSPGSSGQIRIRGNRTLTTSQSSSDVLDGPLLVVDGIPFSGSINDIDPNDVSGLEILKDASATAIFGSRGAGGVILITTKRGRTGKAVMSYDAYYGISKPLGEYKMYNGPEYARFKADATTYNRTSPGTTSYALTQAEQSALTAGVSTDWQKLIYKQGFTTDHKLSLSGGTEGFSAQMVAGTDEHLSGASGIIFYTYNGLISTSMNGGFGSYTDINTPNGVLQYGQALNIDSTTKKQYLAQAKFLRAFWYFYLVQQYGAIPLHTTFITSPSQADSRQPVADVYVQIIKDLTEAAADLPNTPTAPFLGKAACKPVALYFLAKAYLTRGWLTNSAADFTQAYSIASAIISNKTTYGLDLWQDYGDAFNPVNDYGKETIFVSDHDNDPKFGQYTVGGAAGGGAAQNLTPWFYIWNYPSNSGINSYKNGSGALVNSGSSDMVRDAANNSRGIGYTMNVGVDTAIWIPDFEVPGAPQFNGAVPFKGIIIPPSLWTNSYFPSVKKFMDPSRGSNYNDPSTRPVVITRFSDVYLIAVEAAFKSGDLTSAANMINVVRQRAAYRKTNTAAKNATAAAAMIITPAQVMLDFILDERTREFFGEWQRWFDLVRTQSLISRVKAWNPEAAPNIQNFNVLRPIPQDEIDRVLQGPAFPQNPGY